MPWNFFNGSMGVFSAILIIWWLIIGKKQGYFNKLKSILQFKPLMIFVLFLLWSYLSRLWTDNQDYADVSLKYYKYYWIMIPVFMTSLNHKEAKQGFYLFIFTLGLYAFFSLSIALGIIEISNPPTDTSPCCPSNPRGILAYAIVSPYMAITTLSSFILALYSKRSARKYFFYTISLFSFVALFLNNGRAGQLGFIVSLSILFFLYRKFLFNYKILLIIISISLFSLYTLNSLGKLERIKLGISELKNPKKTNYQGSFGQRIYLCKAGIKLIPNHPIVGAGAGDHIDEFIEYTKSHPSEATRLRSFHNQHIDTIMKYGIIGYFLLWGSVAWLLYSLKKSKKYFVLATIFFSVSFFDGVGDIILLMKPYNNIFMLIFLLFSIISLTLRNKHST